MKTSADRPCRIPMRAIRAVARQIAQKFQPEKIILFGSYAYGRPRPESDIDLLVIMDTPLRLRQQRLEISRAISPRPYPYILNRPANPSYWRGFCCCTIASSLLTSPWRTQ